jgi:hypothetical protein
MPTALSPSPSPSPRSLVLAVALCLAGCGRDALVNVPSTPDGRTDAAVVVPPGAGGTGGGTGGAPMGGAGGGRGSDGPTRPPPMSSDGPAAPPPVDAAPSCGTLPACLMTLASACPTSGACSAQRTATTVNQCYASNVKLVAVLTTQGATAKVTRPDGTLCYVVSGSLGRGGITGGQVTYSDDNGKVLATGTFQGGGGGGQIVVMCAGGSTPSPPVSVPVTCAPGASALVGLATTGIGTCTVGTCAP